MSSRRAVLTRPTVTGGVPVAENEGAVPAKKRDPWSGVSTILAMPKVVKAKKRKVAFTKDWLESRLLTSPEFEAACQEEKRRKEAEEAEKERKRVELTGAEGRGKCSKGCAEKRGCKESQTRAGGASKGGGSRERGTAA
jgi:hypothetical protein